MSHPRLVVRSPERSGGRFLAWLLSARIAVVKDNHGFACGCHCRLVQQCDSIRKRLSRIAITPWVRRSVLFVGQSGRAGINPSATGTSSVPGNVRPRSIPVRLVLLFLNSVAHLLGKSKPERHREEMKTRLRSLRALREKILSDLQGSPVAVLKNTSPYLRKETLSTPLHKFGRTFCMSSFVATGLRAGRWWAGRDAVPYEFATTSTVRGAEPYLRKEAACTRDPSRWTLPQSVCIEVRGRETPEERRSFRHPRGEVCPIVRFLAAAVVMLLFWTSLGMTADGNLSQTCIDCHAWTEDSMGASSAYLNEPVCGGQFSQCPVMRSWTVELCVIERFFLVIQRDLEHEKEADPTWYSRSLERMVRAWGLWEDTRTARFRVPLDAVREPLAEVRGELTSLYQELQARRDRRRLHWALVVAFIAGAVLTAAAIAGYSWKKRIARAGSSDDSSYQGTFNKVKYHLSESNLVGEVKGQST